MRDLIRKIPFQFRSKPKIEAILKAIEEELNELDEARSQLETLLYIETAEGVNLDRIGEIVVLSRSDAGLLAAQAGNLDFDVIDDERYRKYLKYKILANTSNATYKDIITAVKMIWGVDKVSYDENLDGPASLTVSFPYNYEGNNIFILPPLTAAGVGINVVAKSEIMSECKPLHSTAFPQDIIFANISEKSVKAAAYPLETKVVPISTAHIHYIIDAK